MNLCREAVKMGVPPGNRPAVPRDWFRGVPDGTSQEPTPEDARKDDHIHGRSSRFMNSPAEGIIASSIGIKKPGTSPGFFGFCGLRFFESY